MFDNLLMLNVHSSKGNKTLKSHEGPGLGSSTIVLKYNFVSTCTCT